MRKRLPTVLLLVTLTWLPVGIWRAIRGRQSSRAEHEWGAALNEARRRAEERLSANGTPTAMLDLSEPPTQPPSEPLLPARPRRRVRRTAALVLAGLVPLTVLGAAAAIAYWPKDLPPPLAPPRNPVLPDLALPALREFYSGTGEDSGRRLLFFTATIANIGQGPLLVHAVRADQRGEWRVSQRFEERGGGLTENRTAGAMVWGGHGHEHWHVHTGASYALATTDGRILRKYEKVGYCFFDQRLFRHSITTAPRTGRFPRETCEGEDRLAVDMGLSPGWSDPYQWTLPDQRLDISRIPDGRYRVLATADPGDWFREADEKNNVTWVEIRLTTSADPPEVKVLRVGPHA